ncbi:ribbon-helix-helix protein, CopG family [Cupriavidus sp. TMH.W2]|uniref:ribbon-helix-helix protein, CopG family n=1 Tax=Cupriavidus sp. TMH.W2 TaxID=3434465 RepID=UPI003D76EB6B
MSRILVDLPEAQVDELAQLVEAEHRPRAAIIRDAVEQYIARRKAGAHVDAFGLWKGKTEGLAYQEGLRSEW